MKRHLIERELTEEGAARRSARGAKRSVTVNLAESPLSWLHSRGHLTDREFDAGERLRTDYERANLAPSITMRWNPLRVDGGPGPELTLSESRIAAKQRFDAALAEAGRGLSDIIWHVVCAGQSIADTEKALNWPARSGKLVLKLALDRVADYYRIR